MQVNPRPAGPGLGTAGRTGEFDNPVLGMFEQVEAVEDGRAVVTRDQAGPAASQYGGHP